MSSVIIIIIEMIGFFMLLLLYKFDKKLKVKKILKRSKDGTNVPDLTIFLE